MTLFIQRDATGTGGSGDSVFATNATLDLVQISAFDFGDASNDGYGELDPSANLIQVTYAQSTTGACPTRLSTLVNTNFGVNSENIDIIIVAVGSGFTLGDGTSMAGNGTARQPGTTGNPTNSVLVFYDVEDNNGNGVCLADDETNEFTLSLPSPVLLYHELSHAFHIAVGDLLSLQTSDPCANASPEEQRAMQDENDMRTQMAQRLRRTTNHCAEDGVDGSCSSSCCVVATVATGSPWSAEVSALRRVRDGLLRRSEIGFDFFAHLHDDYYGFSPEICRLMAGQSALVEKVRDYFVRPLTVCLGLVSDHTVGGTSPQALGRRLVLAVQGSPALASLTAADLAAARAVLDDGELPELLRSPPLEGLARLLDERARGRATVEWALLEPIRTMLAALHWIREGSTDEELGQRLASRFDAWAVDVPLTEVWHGLSRHALAEELAFLGRVLLRGPGPRRAFARRLLVHMGHRPDVAALVAECWGIDTEERA